MPQFYIDRVIQLVPLDPIFQFIGGGSFTESLVGFGPIEVVWGGPKDYEMVYLRFSPNVNDLYGHNVQLRLEAMVPKGHRVLVTMQDIPLYKCFSHGLLRGWKNETFCWILMFDTLFGAPTGPLNRPHEKYLFRGMSCIVTKTLCPFRTIASSLSCTFWS